MWIATISLRRYVIQTLLVDWLGGRGGRDGKERKREDDRLTNDRLLARNRRGRILWVWIRLGGGGLTGMRRNRREGGVKGYRH
jgi:hypothetical protein